MAGKESGLFIFSKTMTQEILENLFDSLTKVRLLKLFLRNSDKFFHQKEISRRVQAEARLVNRQIDKLFKIGFLRIKTIKKERKNLKRGIYFSVNPEFNFYHELRSLISKSSPASKEKILKRVLRLGRIKLLLLAGIFLNSDNSRIDLFIVGDHVSPQKLRSFLKDLESEVGKEIEFAVMNTKEFYYRFHMFDRFVHDILEKPNEKLINKLRL